MKILYCIFLISSLFLFQILAIPPKDTSKILNRISFGSCEGLFGAKNNIFDSVVKNKPDLWIWLGDAAYTDTLILPNYWIPSSREWVQSEYNKQKSYLPYSRLRNSTQIIGVWDDHDFNCNNCGKENPTKDWVKEIFLDYIDEPKDSIRYQRQGLYVSYVYGTGNQKIKIILIDNRYFKEPNNLLGEEQWIWLEKEINEIDNNEIKFTLIGSGIQVLPTNRIIQERWDFPSKQRLLSIISKSKKNGIILLSGDIHMAENLSTKIPEGNMTYNLHEFTSSGLTHLACKAMLCYEDFLKQFLDLAQYDKYLDYRYFYYNFDQIDIDWSNKKNPKIKVSIMNIEGNPVKTVTLSYKDLSYNDNIKQEDLIKYSWYQENWDSITTKLQQAKYRYVLAQALLLVFGILVIFILVLKLLFWIILLPYNILYKRRSKQKQE